MEVHKVIRQKQKTLSESMKRDTDVYQLIKVDLDFPQFQTDWLIILKSEKNSKRTLWVVPADSHPWGISGPCGLITWGTRVRPPSILNASVLVQKAWGEMGKIRWPNSCSAGTLASNLHNQPQSGSAAVLFHGLRRIIGRAAKRRSSTKTTNWRARDKRQCMWEGEEITRVNFVLSAQCPSSLNQTCNLR